MSWDISIHRFGRAYATAEDIPDDEACLPLGSRAEIRAAISRVFAETDWNDPAWGVYRSSAGCIEFNLGDSDPVDGFMLHVRAEAPMVQSIIAMCQANDWQALDCSRGRFLGQPERAAGATR